MGVKNLKRTVVINLSDEFGGNIDAELNHRKDGYSVMHDRTMVGQNVPPAKIDELREIAAKNPAQIADKLVMLSLRFC